MKKKSLRQVKVEELDRLCKDVLMVSSGMFAVFSEDGKSYHWRGPCADCGKEKVLFAAHVYPKGVFSSMRHVVENLLPLCWYCHDRRWHAGITGLRWFEEKWPDRGASLSALAKAKVKVDLAETRASLEDRLKELLGGKTSVQESLGRFTFEP